ncbi:hypothetical protein IAT38_006186 [Cryptococcus sp. DSM 104549]
MILNELIKSGPLAKVWLSAHQERKLSKTQALGVDVGESVEAILTQDAALPLRSSGPLMLGVVRIYSRKVGYLFDDCKEARERISLAFRPGIVDLPEDQLRANRNAITISGARDGGFDFTDWTWGPSAFLVPPRQSLLGAGEGAGAAGAGGLGAGAAGLGAGAGAGGYGAFNFGVPRAPSVYGGSQTTGSRQGSTDPEASHIDSNDFSGIDLGLDFGDLGGEMDDSIEVGRDVRTPFSKEGSAAFGVGRHESRERSMGMMDFGADEMPPMDFGGDDMPMMGDYEPMDLGLDLDEEPARDRRESTTLLTPPPPEAESITDLTPRTAAQISAHPQRSAPKAKRPRLVQPDDELELAEEDQPRDRSGLLGEQRFIPSDPSTVLLQEILADPAAHLLPTVKINGEDHILVGPMGLAPELAELFAFPAHGLRRGRGIEEEKDAPNKRARREDDELEVARRRAGDSAVPFEFPAAGEDDTFVYEDPAGNEFDFGPEEYPAMDMGGTPEPFTFDTDAGAGAGPSGAPREPSMAPSRAESIAREIQYGATPEGEFALAMFDPRTTAGSRAGESQLSQLSTPSGSGRGEQGSQRDGGAGRNTSMAMGLLRKELDAIEEGDRVVSFEKLADKATKRAASAFFFELLSLGTRDCVVLEQPEAYGDIKVEGKEKLWSSVGATQASQAV